VWVKVDDNFAWHPKVVAAGADALVLHVAAMCYCGRMENDGRFPAALVPTLSPLVTGPRARKAEARLLDVGMWEVDGPDRIIHDWLEYQPSRKQKEHERAATRERVKRAREKRSSNAVSNGVRNGVSNDCPDPTRPDPDLYDDDGVGSVPGGASSSSWDPGGIQAAWNAAVPAHMQAQAPPSKPPARPADWPAVFRAVASNPFLCGEGRDRGPATLPWVLAHPEAVLEHATAPADTRTPAQRRRL
jgi:hypothetical protein